MPTNLTSVYAGIYTDVADSTAQRLDISISRRAARLGLARWRIHLSDLEAINFAVADLLLASLIIGAVVVTVRAGLSVGEIFAILTYLIGVTQNLIILPWTYQQLIRAREIGCRIAGN